jgi:hypothetical protein
METDIIRRRNFLHQLSRLSVIYGQEIIGGRRSRIDLDRLYQVMQIIG